MGRNCSTRKCVSAVWRRRKQLLTSARGRVGKEGCVTGNDARVRHNCDRLCINHPFAANIVFTVRGQIRQYVLQCFELLLYNVPTIPSLTFTLSFGSTGLLVFARGKRSRSPLRMNGTRIRKIYGYTAIGYRRFLSTHEAVVDVHYDRQAG